MMFKNKTTPKRKSGSFDPFGNFSSKSSQDEPINISIDIIQDEKKSVSPIRFSQKYEKSFSKILEEKDNIFIEKCSQILEKLGKSQNLLVYYEDETSILTSTFWKELKLSKYKEYFEEYIVVKPSKKKTEHRVNIELLPRLRLKKEKGKPNFIQLALGKLYQGGYVKYIITSNINDSFKESGIPEERIIEIYGNKNKKGKIFSTH